MPDDLWKRRQEQKLQLIGDQLREVLQADNSLERREACDHILDKAGQVQLEFSLLMTQLRVLAKQTKQDELARRIKQQLLDTDLEMLAMETIFEGYPEDYKDET